MVADIQVTVTRWSVLIINSPQSQRRVLLKGLQRRQTSPYPLQPTVSGCENRSVSSHESEETRVRPTSKYNRLKIKRINTIARSTEWVVKFSYPFPQWSQLTLIAEDHKTTRGQYCRPPGTVHLGMPTFDSKIILSETKELEVLQRIIGLTTMGT